MSPSPEFWKKEAEVGANYDKWKAAKMVGYDNHYHCTIETRAGVLIGELCTQSVVGSGSIDIDISKTRQIGLRNLRTLLADPKKEIDVRELYKRIGLKFGSNSTEPVNFSSSAIGKTVYLAINRNLSNDDYEQREDISGNVSKDARANGLAKYFSENLKTKFIVSPITEREISQLL